MYEQMDDDPSEETEKKVVRFVEKLLEKGHIAETTAEFIKNKTKDIKTRSLY